ncbi:hypothetical protein B0H14DRAFT_3863558, partial [Mycena olivaceomarginata]
SFLPSRRPRCLPRDKSYQSTPLHPKTSSSSSPRASPGHRTVRICHIRSRLRSGYGLTRSAALVPERLDPRGPFPEQESID